MPCLFALFAGFLPRVANVILWLARPTLYSAPFNGSWFWPLLGIVFLPYTTLFYVFLWSPGVGLAGWDWLWIAMAVFMDVSSLAGHYRANQERMAASAGSQSAA